MYIYFKYDIFQIRFFITTLYILSPPIQYCNKKSYLTIWPGAPPLNPPLRGISSWLLTTRWLPQSQSHLLHLHSSDYLIPSTHLLVATGANKLTQRQRSSFYAAITSSCRPPPCGCWTSRNLVWQTLKRPARWTASWTNGPRIRQTARHASSPCKTLNGHMTQ